MTAPPPGLPPPVMMLQMMNGMLVSRCVALAAELGIADQLREGPRSPAALATATGSDPAALYRVLRTLAGVGVFAEQPGGEFQNTPLSEALQSDVPGSVRSLARWLGHPMHWRVVGDLDHSVRTGRPSVNKDQPERPPFVVLSQDASAQAAFNEAMTGHSLAAGAAILSAYDFSPFRRIIDVGGGHGSLSVMIAKAAPAASIVVFDLPHVVEGARQNIAGAGLEARISTAGGTFLEALPGKADLCVLKHILHLVDDAAAARILSNCRAALEPGGKILVCELLVSPGPEGMPARIMDLEMLLGTGGRERTEAEFAQVAAAAGLELVRIIETRMPLRLLEIAAAR